MPVSISDNEASWARRELELTQELARTKSELNSQAKELQESLEYQTAISEVLAVISRSANELQPVLNVVAENAARVCMASDAHVFRVDGNRIRARSEEHTSELQSR